VALESLSFGNGALQNEKKLFHQATKKNLLSHKFFLLSDKKFLLSDKLFLSSDKFFVA